MIDINKQTNNIIYQISIFILEIIFVIGILTKISLILFPLENLFSWELIERIIGLYTVYQIFIFSTLNQIDDSEKDSYNSLKALCEESLIYLNLPKEIRDKNDKFKNHLREAIEAQKSPSAMNSEEVLEEYDKLLNNINAENIENIKINIINYNHWLYHLDLKFRTSLFLRKFKNPEFDIKFQPIIIFSCILILYVFYWYL